VRSCLKKRKQTNKHQTALQREKKREGEGERERERERERQTRERDWRVLEDGGKEDTANEPGTLFRVLAANVRKEDAEKKN
jgi:hypothetical protein